jgi:hypothetical protein
MRIVKADRARNATVRMDGDHSGHWVDVATGCLTPGSKEVPPDSSKRDIVSEAKGWDKGASGRDW